MDPAPSRSVDIVSFAGRHCSMEISRPADGVVFVKLCGHDVGEFGNAPFRELEHDLASGLPIEVFVDARAVPAASIEVSGQWAQWMMASRRQIQRLNLVCQTRFVEVTAKFVRQFTEFGSRMKIYTDVTAFDEALRLAQILDVRPRLPLA